MENDVILQGEMVALESVDLAEVNVAISVMDVIDLYRQRRCKAEQKEEGNARFDHTCV